MEKKNRRLWPGLCLLTAVCVFSVAEACLAGQDNRLGPAGDPQFAVEVRDMVTDGLDRNTGNRISGRY